MKNLQTLVYNFYLYSVTHVISITQMLFPEWVRPWASTTSCFKANCTIYFLRKQHPQQAVCGSAGWRLFISQTQQLLVLTTRDWTQHPTKHIYTQWIYQLGLTVSPKSHIYTLLDLKMMSNWVTPCLGLASVFVFIVWKAETVATEL